MNCNVYSPDNITITKYLQLSHRVFREQFFQPATALWKIPELLVLTPNLKVAGRILDLGCGDGRLAKIFLSNRKPSDLTGVDLDFGEVSMAAEQRIYGVLYCATASLLPEKDAAFNQVVSNCVLEHIPEIEKAICEVSRVLKKGGEFIFTVPQKHFHTFLPLARFLSFLHCRKWQTAYCQHIDKRLSHFNYLSRDEWNEMLRRYSLQIVQTNDYFSRIEIFGWELLSNLTGGLAFLLSRKKSSPRMIQKRMGLLSVNLQWLGSVTFSLLVPWLVLCWLLRQSQHCGCFLVRAIKD
jgi:ubiquinone/menaquinone biosynthesis C-methylase UbiE